jgi:hypothetical protein
VGIFINEELVGIIEAFDFNQKVGMVTMVIIWQKPFGVEELRRKR